MGKLYQAVCPLCSYEEEFSLGSGLLSIRLLQSMRVLQAEEQEQIQKLYDCGEVVDFSVEQKLVRCSWCDRFGQLKTQTIIEIIDQKQEQHVFGDQCHDCNNKFEIYDEEELLTEDTQASLCPKCGKKSLSFRSVGFWD